MLADWIRLRKNFLSLEKYCRNLAGEATPEAVNAMLKEAGKLFFEKYSDFKELMELDNGFSCCPIIESVTDAHGKYYKTLECYAEYWICLIGYFGRTDIIKVGNRKLFNAEIPRVKNVVFWRGLLCDKECADILWSKEKDFLVDVCRDSISLCDVCIKMADKLKNSFVWPDTHITLSQAKREYGIPLPTMRSWKERAKDDGLVKIDLITHPHKKNNYAVSRKWLDHKAQQRLKRKGK